jgi:hypothetical protein
MAGGTETVAEVAVTEKFFSLADLEQAPPDTVYAVIDVPELKTKMRLGSLTAEGMIAWMEGNSDPLQKNTAGLRLLVLSLVDVNNKRIGEVYLGGQLKPSPEMMQAFKKRDARFVGRLCNEAYKVNGMEDQVKAEAKKEEAKNVSGEAASVVSPSV